MERAIRIAVIGDFDGKRASHAATREALQHAAAAISSSIDIQWFPTQALEKDIEQQGLESFNGIWGAPGVPESSPGVINAIRFSALRHCRLPTRSKGFYCVNVIFQ